MIQFAIVGPTASGKSDLAISLAKKIDAYILSIDSLSVYKEIDIVSAKPSKDELAQVKHFGVDVLYPNEYFSVDIFINLYKELLQICENESKNLIIVGGTSFYLKSLIDGLSPIPKITHEIQNRVKEKLKNLDDAYKELVEQDPLYMENINPGDRYRIEKALLIFEASKKSPSIWFKENPPVPIIRDLQIFNIEVQRDVLRERIAKRTSKMLSMGLLDEVAYLEQKYGSTPNAMHSIGIVEVLEYFDSKVTLEQMLENISIHTAQLAKRQQTFNRGQFPNIISATLDKLENIILKSINYE
jgi:tRNA dimethylallyltransferase